MAMFGSVDGITGWEESSVTGEQRPRVSERSFLQPRVSMETVSVRMSAWYIYQGVSG